MYRLDITDDRFHNKTEPELSQIEKLHLYVRAGELKYYHILSLSCLTFKVNGPC